jgi:hypothetical protein
MQRVKSVVVLEAEGHLFDIGTEFDVERMYEESCDIYHKETGVLLWCRYEEVVPFVAEPAALF